MELFKKVSSVVGAGVLAVGLTGAAYGLVGAGSGGSTTPSPDPCAALKPQKPPGGVMSNINNQFVYLNCLTQAAGQNGTQADPCASLKPQSLGIQGLGGIQGIGGRPGASPDAYIKCLIDATQGATPTGSSGTGGSNGATGGGGKATPNGDAHTGTGSAPASGGPVNFNVTNNNTSSNSNSSPPTPTPTPTRRTRASHRRTRHLRSLWIQHPHRRRPPCPTATTPWRTASRQRRGWCSLRSPNDSPAGPSNTDGSAGASGGRPTLAERGRRRSAGVLAGAATAHVDERAVGLQERERLLGHARVVVPHAVRILAELRSLGCRVGQRRSRRAVVPHHEHRAAVRRRRHRPGCPTTASTSGLRPGASAGCRTWAPDRAGHTSRSRCSRPGGRRTPR